MSWCPVVRATSPRCMNCASTWAASPRPWTRHWTPGLRPTPKPCAHRGAWPPLRPPGTCLYWARRSAPWAKRDMLMVFSASVPGATSLKRWIAVNGWPHVPFCSYFISSLFGHVSRIVLGFNLRSPGLTRGASSGLVHLRSRAIPGISAARM